MSQLLQGAGVKSVQRGSINLSGGAAGVVFVSDVDMNKSSLSISCSSGVGVLPVSSAKIPFHAGAHLSAADEITYQASLENWASTSSQATLFWELVEFY